MRGSNRRLPVVQDADALLTVNRMYYSLADGGPFAGEPCIVLRLAGCGLACRWCDVDFEPIEFEGSAGDVAARVVDLRARQSACGLVVLTGGEPLRQPVAPLIRRLNDVGMRVLVETSGHVWRDELDGLFAIRRATGELPEPNVVVCSPKTPHVADGLGPRVHALKYMLRTGETCIRDGLPAANPQEQATRAIRVARPSALRGPAFLPRSVYVQPLSTGSAHEDARYLDTAVAVSQRYGYTLALSLPRVLRLRGE